MRRHARVLFAVAALASFFAFATSASAALVHPFETTIGPEALVTPRNAAVDQSNGNIYTTGYFAGSVQRVDSSGAPADFSALGSNEIGGISWDGAALQIAVDNSGGANAGNFYLTNSFGGGIQAFKATGEPANFSASASYLSANTIGGTPSGVFTEACGVAVDENGAIYVGDIAGNVDVYAPSGQYLTQAAVPNACNVAVDGDGNVYVNAPAGEVSRIEPSAFPVTASTTYGAPSTVTSMPANGIAVDPADDNLYVNNGSFVAQYDSAANANAPVGLFGSDRLEDSRGVAIDRSGGANDGDVLVQPQPFSFSLLRFGPAFLAPNAATEPPTGLTGTKATLHGTVGADGGPSATCEFAYVTEAAFQANRFAGAQTVPCAPAGPFTGSGETAVSAALTALTPETGYRFRLEATNANGTNFGLIQSFTTPSAVKAVATGTATNLTPSSATLNGTVTPGALELSECKFEYGTSAAYGQTAPCAESNATIGTGETPVAVHADVSGLVPGDYHFRLVAMNAEGSTRGDDTGFSIVAPPTISGESASVSYPEASYAEAVLRGTVNPENDKTTYYFEYGPTASYGETTPPRELEAGIVTRNVVALLSPLDRGATYHFRIVASNAAGTTNSADQVFTTQPAPPADTCPNAGIRALQHAGGLGDCRAYEMVSPVDKGGNALDVRNTVQTTPDGEMAAYSMSGATPEAATSVLGAYYRSWRSASGWQYEGLDAPQDNPDGLISGPTLFMSSDFSHTLQASREALLPGAIQTGSNLYLRNNLTGSRSLALAAPGRGLIAQLAAVGPFFPIAATPDLSHFVFTSITKLLPDATSGNFTPSVYELDEGELRLVSYLPDGSVDPEGSAIFSFAREPRPMSADGRIVYFQSLRGSVEASGPLYARIDGTTTKPISVSHRSGDPSTPQNARFGGASSDGKIVYFTSPSPLTDDATPSTTVGNLYRYNLDTDQLTNLSASAGPAGQADDIGRIKHVSADGAYVYFSAFGSEGINRLFVAHDGSTKAITELDSLEGSGPVGSVTSPNGRFLAFTSFHQLTSAPVNSPNCKENTNYANGDGRCVEMYLYDAQTESLRCMSCDPIDGELGFAELSPQTQNISYYTARAVLDDGRAFFNSDSRLVAADVNQQRDAYEYDDGKLALISSGRHSEPSTIADVSPDGRDVFLFTSERLVASDTDKEVDLYDARVGGGLAGQNEARSGGLSLCEGQGCRGPATQAPPGVAPVSASFEGPPSAKPKRPNKHRRKGKSKAKRRHANKKHQGRKHQNRANGNRGGHR